MNSYERVMNTLTRKKTDRVPIFDYLFQKDIYQFAIKKRPEYYNSIDVVECCLALGIDIAALAPGGPAGFQNKRIDSRTYIDEWGTMRITDSASWPTDAPVAFPITCWTSLKAYNWPDASDQTRYCDMAEAVELAGEKGIVTAGGVLGPLSLAWLLMGPEALFIAMYEEPDLVQEIFKKSNQFFIESAVQQIKKGVDFMFIAEDLGHSQGGFLSLDMFRDMVKPHLEEMVESITVPILLHSCGNIESYMDDLVQMGFVAIHPLQRTAGMDLEKMIRRYGNQVCFIGNIDSSGVLAYGNPSDVREQVRECIDISGAHGGYILASDHSLHDGIPVENILAMLDEAKVYSTAVQASR